MPVVFGAASTPGASNYSTPITVPRPAGTVAGDTLVAIAVSDEEGSLAAMPAPSGWAARGAGRSQTGVGFGKVFTLVAGTSEPANYVFNYTAGAGPEYHVHILRLTGALDIVAGPTWAGSGSASTSHVAPSVDVPVDGLRVCGFFGNTEGAGNASYTSYSAGMVERTDRIDTADPWACLATATEAGAGAGTRTATFSRSEPWLAVAMAFGPGSAGGSAGGPAAVDPTLVTVVEDDPRAGVPFMTDSLGPASRLLVEAAFGADIAGSSDTWAWTDITSAVQQRGGGGVAIVRGRGDEASTTQPSSCSMLLDNRDGEFSLGGQAAHWPYIRRNTPIRVRVSFDAGATWLDRFCGYANGWSPDWDVTGRDATVALSCSGSLRRLAQAHGTPGISPYRRATLAAAKALGLVAYWPAEQTGDTRTVAAAVGDRDMVAESPHAAPTWAASTVFGCSAALPTVPDCTLVGTVPSHRTTGEAQVRMLLHIPSGGKTGDVLLWLQVSGSSDEWWIEYEPGGAGGQLRVRCEDDDGSTAVNTLWNFGVDGSPLLLDLSLQQVGSSTTYALTVVREGETVAQVGAGSASGRGLGRVREVWINDYLDDEDDGVDPPEHIAPSSTAYGVGHITVANKITSVADVLPTFSSHRGEHAPARLARIAAESGLALTVLSGGPNPPPQPADYLGPQQPGGLVSLLRQVEASEGGVLYDGETFGLTYVDRRYRYSRPADLTIDVAQHQLAQPFHPVDDDQAQANSVTALRPGGGGYTAVDIDGPLGIRAIGAYEQGVEVSADSDLATLRQAEWLVHLGTVAGYRYPTVAIDLANHPELAAGWAGMRVGGRVAVLGLADARTQHPGGDQSFTLEGSVERINQHQWDVTMNCSLYDAYRVAVLGDGDGDLGEFVPRLAPTTSALAVGVAAGASTLQVATTAVPVCSDSFTRTDTAGWGTADVGGPWRVAGTTGSAAQWTVGGGVGRIALPPPGGHRMAWLPQVAHADVDAVITAGLTTSNVTGAPLGVGLMIRGRGLGDYLLAWVSIGVDEAVSVGLFTADGSVIAPMAPAGFILAAGGLRLRVQAVDTAVRARAWPASGSEPSTWHASGAAAEGVTGWVGVRAETAPGNTNGTSATFDQLAVTGLDPVGALWTTDPADYPLTLDVGGIPVTATGCAGTGSPQTFTVAPGTVLVGKPPGTRVDVWAPPVLGL